MSKSSLGSKVFVILFYLTGCITLYTYPGADNLVNKKSTWAVVSLTSWFGIAVCLSVEGYKSIRTYDDKRWEKK